MKEAIAMRRQGFTLVELLAVLVVLAVILAISVPTVSNIIRTSTMKTFENDVKMVLNAIRLKQIEDDSLDPTEINETNINTMLGLSNENYSDLKIEIHNNEEDIAVKGQGKWAGFSACGTFRNIKVNEGECANDFEDPVITLLGDDTVTIFVGDEYIDAGATATDDADEDITDKIVLTGEVNVNLVGTYILSYDVTDNSGRNAVTVTRTVHVIDTIYSYENPGAYTFVAPRTGTYKLEVWGAEGGGYNTFPTPNPEIPYNCSQSGRGGYSTGNISLTKGQTIYIYVGGTGSTSGPNTDWTIPKILAGGWNGGGSSINTSGSVGSGGGATDIRTGGNDLSNRVIVAGGGGAGTYVYNTSDANGGYGGGTTGGSGHTSNWYGGGAGTQTAGGGTTSGAVCSFGGYANVTDTTAGILGQGGNGSSCRSWQTPTQYNPGGGGGGGGYYGGGGGLQGGGGGGSSYTGGVTNVSTIAGNASMPAPGGGTEMGHTGHGYARITFISP